MPSQHSLRFTLTPDPVSPGEQRVLERDTAAHGLDDRFWRATNGLLTVRSRSDTPLVLRAYRGPRLAGVAHVLECRRTSQCFFPGRFGRLLDTLPMPIYLWTRGDPAVDLLGSPGLLAAGEDREAFYRDAVGFLNQRYVLGAVMEERGGAAADDCCETGVMDWGHYTVRPGGVEELLDAHKHLRRKMNRFRNKGGTLQVLTGALDAPDRDAVLHCLRHSASLGLVRTPYQENYANMVHWAAASGAPGIIHILARLDGVIVGYHAFLHTGGSLQCLSGGFDRGRHSTYHAYENILIEAMSYAEAGGIRRVSFGPVGNPSKAAVMPEFGRFVLRFYSRFSTILRVLALVVPRSALRPEVFAPCSGLEARSGALPLPVEPGAGRAPGEVDAAHAAEI